MRFSVIIPVHNGSDLVVRCLAALAASTWRDYETLVVDDGSSDASAEAARAAGANVLRRERRGGPARARNQGAQQARGEILVFFDADVCPHPDTLARIDDHFRSHPDADAVFGSYDDRPAHPSFVSQYKNLFHHFIHQRSRSDAWTFWAGCGAIRREAFLAAGGFDERYDRPCIEDIELGARLATDGRRIDLDAAIQVTHLKRWTLRGLIRTDVFDRAVPWLALMLRTRRMPPDLNVTHAHRASVVLAWLLFFGSIAVVSAVFAGDGAGAMQRALVVAPIAVGLLALNLDLYRFFSEKRGLWFTVRAVALHWLYYFYCGVGVVLGVAAYLTGPRDGRDSKDGRDARCRPR